MVRKAFKQAQAMRPGAVYLAIPQDIETMPAPLDALPLPVNLVRDTAPSPSQVARAVTLLQQAKAPLLLAGHGAARAHAQEAFSPAQINPTADKQIIHTHTFPAEVDDHYTLAVGIEGNIVLTLDALAQQLAPKSGLRGIGQKIRAVHQEEREGKRSA